MLFLITEMLVALVVTAALGAIVAWLARDLMAKREHRRLVEGWQRQLRSSEARAGTFKNQLFEAKQTEENLRADLRLIKETSTSSGPADAGGGETVAVLEAELARRDKKIEILELQVSQSEAALTSEWQSLKALKTEVAERQRRLDTRGKERGTRLKASEEAQRELRKQIVALRQELSGVQEASEQAMADARRRTSARSKELERAQGELAERDATITRLTDALERAESEAGAPTEDDDLEKLRGIGPVLRRKLNQAGIHSFGQIAAWTDDDLERVASQVGASAGRIRRDRWIETAKELQQANDRG